MYEQAKSAREAMKAKAKRLAGASSDKVDASDYKTPTDLKADVKTGMRPVSRRAFKAGGKVSGEEAVPRADRAPRKGKGAGKSEAKEWVAAKINRNLKDANEEREGEKHVGGLKSGGRAKRQNGGPPPRTALERIKDALGLGPKSRNAGEAPPAGASPHPPEERAALGRMMEEAVSEPRRHGGRAKKMAGGSADRTKSDVVKPKAMEFGQNLVTPGLKKGGKVARKGKLDGGAIVRGGGLGLMPALLASEMGRKDKDEDAGPMKKGGRVGKFAGGAMGRPSMPPQAMGGMGGGMGGGQMPQLPPQAMANAGGMAQGRPFRKAGGRIQKYAGGPVGMASGGDVKRAKTKGPTNINIVIAAGGKDPAMPPPGAMPPGGQPPGIPIPVGAGGPPPGAGMPMAGGPPGMPMPMGGLPGGGPGGLPPGIGGLPGMGDDPAAMGGPAGGPAGMPPGMPMPRKSGGRVKGYMKSKAGSGSGLGRLKKAGLA
jgi:hypothetical protein